MRRAYKHLVLFALVSMFVGLGMTASHAESSLAQTAPPPDPRPNIIFILTDDMRYDDLNRNDADPRVEYMPKTIDLLADQGMSFKNAFVSNALCCPTRATIMRGQYAHNTDIWYNVNHFNPNPGGFDGGWEGYEKNGYEKENIATQLDLAGYHTGLFGKYLNQYGEGVTNDPPPPRPAGWDEWFAFLHPINYLNYDVNVNYEDDDMATTRRHYGTKSSDYSTDVLNTEVQKFIADSVAPGNKPPFFAYVAPKAPHDPFASVPRHQHDFDTVKAPRLPSFDEQDVTDKPPWIQSWRRLTSDDKAAINDRHEKRVESLRSVDDLVGNVVHTLETTYYKDPVTGQPDRNRPLINNTYIVFTSDNGWYHGEHRVRSGKGRPYEEAPHVPLVIRGPSVPAGKSTDKLVLDTDYFPTFMELAAPTTPTSYPLDGRSLLPVLKDPNTTSWGRTAILLEGRGGNDPEIPVDRNYNGIRTTTSKYVEYEGTFEELYDLRPNADPYELTNIYPSPNGTVPTLSVLDSRLDELKQCNRPGTTGPSCEVAEDRQ
jgi:N-acetylglucosamine-6-sulfatase